MAVTPEPMVICPGVCATTVPPPAATPAFQLLVTSKVEESKVSRNRFCGVVWAENSPNGDTVASTFEELEIGVPTKSRLSMVETVPVPDEGTPEVMPTLVRLTMA